jgi:uridine kinase
MSKVFFVTGASGSGKTTIIKELERLHPDHFVFYYFDSVGVPSFHEMKRKYGSGEAWQRQTTIQWVKQIKREFLPQKSAILEGQMRISFILEACKENDISDFQIFLFDCNDEERKKRLISRGQSDLANQKMLDWAEYLRNEVVTIPGAIIFDTSSLQIEEAVTKLWQVMNKN